MTDIHRTVFTVEVFSRGPFAAESTDDDPFDLAAINYAITDGDCIGWVERTHVMIVPPEAIEGELLRIGNDGTFFDDVVASETSTCRHCQRRIIRTKDDPDTWIDPEATGDDGVWRETCDSHDTFTAEHEPKESQ